MSNDGHLLLVRERDFEVGVRLRHLVARFHRARIANPPAKLLGVVFEQAAGDGGPGADVGKVRALHAHGQVAADGVTGAASLGGEETFALRDQGRVFVLLGRLLCAPGLEWIDVERLRDAGFVLFEGAQRVHRLGGRRGLRGQRHQEQPARYSGHRLVGRRALRPRLRVQKKGALRRVRQ